MVPYFNYLPQLCVMFPLPRPPQLLTIDVGRLCKIRRDFCVSTVHRVMGEGCNGVKSECTVTHYGMP